MKYSFVKNIFAFGLFGATVYGGSFDAAEMLNAVNEQRKANGKGSMCYSSKIMAGAQKQSQYQASINQMTHDGPESLMSRFTNQGFQPSSVAENVAAMPDFNVASVMNSWMNSAAHKANILGDYSHFGVGAMQGSNGQVYWTQQFAKASNPSEPCADGSQLPQQAQNQSTTQSQSAVPQQSQGQGTMQPQNGMSLVPQQAQNSMPSMPQQQVPSMTAAPLMPPSEPQAPQNTIPGQMQAPSIPNQTAMNINVPSGPKPKFVCLHNSCYRIVTGPLGDGFLPDSFRPQTTDISGNPVLIY